MNRLLPAKGRSPVQSHPLLILAVTATVASMAFGCGEDEPAPVSVPEVQNFRDVGLDQEASALVPAEIKSAGPLIVPTAATYPPNEFLAQDGTSIIGMDPDLTRAIGQRLGLEVKMVAADFDAIIPSVADGARKVSLSSITITPERVEEVDLVSYFEAGTGFFATHAEPNELSGLSGLCGHSVAVASGTVQLTDAKRQSRKCVAEGKQAVALRTTTNQANATALVEAGKSDFGMADSPVAAYIVKQSEGRLLKVGEDYGIAPYGVAVNRDSGLAPAIERAINSLIADGSYKEILARWGLEDGAVSRATTEP